MKLIFIHGKPGVGKYTVAKKLQELTGFRLFHNHLIVDTLLSVFDSGSKQFVKLREHFRLEVFRGAACSGISYLFTVAPEKTVLHSFIDETIKTINRAKGKILFVELLCDQSELKKRVEDPTRKQFSKLQSIRRWKELQQEGAFEFPVIDSEIRLDTTELSPEGTAQIIFKSIKKN